MAKFIMILRRFVRNKKEKKRKTNFKLLRNNSVDAVNTLSAFAKLPHQNHFDAEDSMQGVGHDEATSMLVPTL